MRERDARWFAVYGAYVAARVHDRMRSGLGYDGIAMDELVEDAATVADDAEEAWQRSHAQASPGGGRGGSDA